MTTAKTPTPPHLGYPTHKLSQSGTPAPRQPVNLLRHTPTTAPPVYSPQTVPKVLQRKTTATAPPSGTHQTHRQPPSAPPAYRPNAAQKCLQPKAATKQCLQPKTAINPPPAVQTRHAPVAPPVYRPQLAPKVLQAKLTAAAAGQPSQRVNAPAAYRPQPTPKVLQMKRGGTADVAQGNPVGRSRVAPPVYNPNATPLVLQSNRANPGRAPLAPSMLAGRANIQRYCVRGTSIQRTTESPKAPAPTQEISLSKSASSALIPVKKGSKTKLKELVEKIKGYKVKLDSTVGVASVKEGFPDYKNRVKARATPWNMTELQAIQEALDMFFLGKPPRHLQTLSKVDFPKTKGDKYTLAWSEKRRQNIAFFKRGEDRTLDDLRGTAVHELTHMELQPEFDDMFRKATRYWNDPKDKGNKFRFKALLPSERAKEEPVSEYGTTDIYEDMAEAVRVFFAKGMEMQGTHPLRFEAILNMIPDAARNRLAKDQSVPKPLALLAPPSASSSSLPPVAPQSSATPPQELVHAVTSTPLPVLSLMPAQQSPVEALSNLEALLQSPSLTTQPEPSPPVSQEALTALSNALPPLIPLKLNF